MMDLVFVGSHLGYPMDRTPLGGGAMVGRELARRWATLQGVRLTSLGSGPEAPAPGSAYVRLPGRDADLVRYSELEYARFCREFERATTDHILAPGRYDPRKTCVVLNDISEASDIAALTRAGFPTVSIWHVDVVDFFNRIYLGNVFGPERATGVYEKARAASWLVPDVLKLVFEKQRDVVLHADRLILPSRGMGETLRRCYGALQNGKGTVAERIRVRPWGGWDSGVPEPVARAKAEELRRRYGLRPETRVLVTLSRLSPEKGVHRLLQALRRLEERAPGLDVCLFVCGEPAFMKGDVYTKQLRREAARLRRFRVIFPGYLDAEGKQAYLRLGDLFVSASLHESYGLTLVEALRAGLPVLAAAHYGAEEIVSRDFGRLIAARREADVPEGLAQALAELLPDREALRVMGEFGREAGAGMDFDEAARAIADECRGLACA